MKSSIRVRRPGFTIVELLIVIVVIGILAAIVVSTFTGAQAKARDTVRKHDLAAIAKALKVRSLSHSNPIRSGASCTMEPGGFFTQTGISLTGSDYGAKSAMTCLQEESGLQSNFVDPSGATSCVSGEPDKCFVYMYKSCSLGTYIYAHLETEPNSSTATDNTCDWDFDSNWGMNYHVRVPAP